MTTEEFIEKYENCDSVLEIVDDVYAFFSKELSEDTIEEYDFYEIILDMVYGFEKEKEFDKLIKFAELIKEKQPKIYEKEFPYIERLIFIYYCFHNKHKKVEEIFSKFINNPTKDIDRYMSCFNYLLYYGYIDIIHRAITENFKIIRNDKEIIRNIDYYMAFWKFYILLDEYYQKGGQKDFNIKKILEIMKDYRLNYDKEDFSVIEKAIRTDNLKSEEIKELLNSKTYMIFTLSIYFLKYMKSYNIPFVISATIWDDFLSFIVEYTESNVYEPNNYFDIDPYRFERYLASIFKNSFIDRLPKIFAILWGSVYIYDFLRSNEIIDESTHTKSIESIKKLKGKFIAIFLDDLWKASFIHSWKKPDSISSKEFTEEEKIFRKSIDFREHNTAILLNNIKEELSKIGELSIYIKKELRSIKKKNKKIRIY